MEINLGETFFLNQIQHNQKTLVRALSSNIIQDRFSEIGCYSQGIPMVLRASAGHLYCPVEAGVALEVRSVNIQKIMFNK